MYAKGTFLLGLLIAVVHLSHGLSAAAMPVLQTGTIVEIEPSSPPGMLKVSRKQGDEPIEGTINMPIWRGNLLILAKGAKAAIVCEGIYKRFPLTPGATQNSPCSARLGLKKTPWGFFSRQRTGADTSRSTFPVIISPRGTLVLNPRPRLRWSAAPPSAPGASATDAGYLVSIKTDSNQLIWSIPGVHASEMAYPSDQKPLLPGKYLLVVQTGGRDSNNESWPGRGFTVLPECPAPTKRGAPACMARQVREEEGRIREMNLPDDSTHLLLAKLYASRKLYAEALEALERISEAGRTPAVISRMGDLYALTGLNREAVNLYLRALGLPAMTSDKEEQALTIYHLGLAYDKLGQTTQARARYEEAISAYKKLGDKETMKLLMQLRRLL